MMCWGDWELSVTCDAMFPHQEFLLSLSVCFRVVLCPNFCFCPFRERVSVWVCLVPCNIKLTVRLACFLPYMPYQCSCFISKKKKFQSHLFGTEVLYYVLMLQLAQKQDLLKQWNDEWYWIRVNPREEVRQKQSGTHHSWLKVWTK